MRVFISVDFPDEVKEKIKKIQAELPEFTGKKTEFENLHLTLKFLGEISEEQAEKVKEKLKEIKLKKREAEIDDLGVFSESFVRIIWLHSSGLEELQKEIDGKLSDFFGKERRFMGHITIARVKNIKNKEKFLAEFRKIKIKPIKFEADKFKLKKSILTAEKPVYEDIGEYKLE